MFYILIFPFQNVIEMFYRLNMHYKNTYINAETVRTPLNIFPNSSFLVKHQP